VLNQSDGETSLLDIASRSELDFPVVSRAADLLERAGLLSTSPERPPSSP
jgi:aminopeptidase-like protein